MAELKELKNVITGFVIGVASILPGISGGLIAVLCGVYERLVNDIGDIVHKLVPEFWFLATLGGGILLGMFATSVALDGVLGPYQLQCLMFFFGLILAQIPDVYRMSETEEPFRPRYLICLAFGLAVMAVMMIFGTGGNSTAYNDHTWQNAMILLFAGIVFGIAKIAPGISGSTLLLAFGLFDLSIRVFAHLDLFLLIPLCIGLLIGIFGFAKVMSWLMANHRCETYYAILGLTVGSLGVIYQNAGISTWEQALTGVVFMVLGIIVSYAFILYGRKQGHY
jgi:putative membrane protein